MRQNARTFICFCLLYLALITMGVGPLFLLGGSHDAIFGIALVIAVALIPGTAIVLTLLMPRFARNTVVDAADAPRASQVSAARARFEIAFAAWNGIESGEAVQRLSRRLFMLDIDHSYTNGEILVRDRDIRWSVSPVVGTLRIAGWVEAPTPDEGAMIVDAVEEFLIDELGIRLEKFAA